MLPGVGTLVGLCGGKIGSPSRRGIPSSTTPTRRATPPKRTSRRASPKDRNATCVNRATTKTTTRHGIQSVASPLPINLKKTLIVIPATIRSGLRSSRVICSRRSRSSMSYLLGGCSSGLRRSRGLSKRSRRLSRSASLRRRASSSAVTARVLLLLRTHPYVCRVIGSTNCRLRAR